MLSTFAEITLSPLADILFKFESSIYIQMSVDHFGIENGEEEGVGVRNNPVKCHVCLLIINIFLHICTKATHHSSAIKH